MYTHTQSNPPQLVSCSYFKRPSPFIIKLPSTSDHPVVINCLVARQLQTHAYIHTQSNPPQLMSGDHYIITISYIGPLPITHPQLFAQIYTNTGLLGDGHTHVCIRKWVCTHTHTHTYPTIYYAYTIRNGNFTSYLTICKQSYYLLLSTQCHTSYVVHVCIQSHAFYISEKATYLVDLLPHLIIFV